MEIIDSWVDETRGARVSKIRPGDIELQESGATGYHTFGKHEVELAAGHLISFFKWKGRWVSFSILELADFYTMQGLNPDTMFYGLLGAYYDDGGLGAFVAPQENYLICGSDGRYRVTPHFIEACCRSFAAVAA